MRRVCDGVEPLCWIDEELLWSVENKDRLSVTLHVHDGEYADLKELKLDNVAHCSSHLVSRGQMNLDKMLGIIRNDKGSAQMRRCMICLIWCNFTT